MAAEKFMTPSSEFSAIREVAAPYGAELQLPDDPGLRSEPSRVSLPAMLARNRQLRAWFPRGIRTAEERWQAKTDKEFCL